MQNYLLVLTLPLLLLAGCETPRTYYQARKDPFIAVNYEAVDALVNAGKQTPLAADATLMVGNLVNVDRLDESSGLGKSIAEQVQSRFAQHGYHVVAMKLRGPLFVNKAERELALSPEVMELGANSHAQGVIVGTYAIASDFVYVSLKLVGNDNTILGAHDYTLPRESNIRALLKKPCC